MMPNTYIQARVVDAMFNRVHKYWDYDAITEFVDEDAGECGSYDERTQVKALNLYCFNDTELVIYYHPKKDGTYSFCIGIEENGDPKIKTIDTFKSVKIDQYIVMKKQ